MQGVAISIVIVSNNASA